MLKNYKSAVLLCLVLRFFVTVDISVQITKILKEEVLNISVPKNAISLWTHIPTFAAIMSFFHCLADVVQYRTLIPQTR